LQTALLSRKIKHAEKFIYRTQTAFVSEKIRHAEGRAKALGLPESAASLRILQASLNAAKPEPALYHRILDEGATVIKRRCLDEISKKKSAVDARIANAPASPTPKQKTWVRILTGACVLSFIGWFASFVGPPAKQVGLTAAQITGAAAFVVTAVPLVIYATKVQMKLKNELVEKRDRYDDMTRSVREIPELVLKPDEKCLSGYYRAIKIRDDALRKQENQPLSARLPDAAAGE